MLLSPNIPKKNSFNFIRLICCLIVIYEHTVILSGSENLLLNLRGLAVNVFFILSGFWVTFSYLNSSSFKDYLVKRFKKIFPMYWTVVISFAFILFFIRKTTIEDYFGNRIFWKYLISNIFTLNFIQNSLPGVFINMPYNGAVNGSLWTIKIEIGFYLILPIVLLIIQKLNDKRKYANIILIVLYLLSILYSFIVEYIINNYNKFSSLRNQLPGVLTFFLCGMAYIINWDFLLKKINELFIPSLIITLICYIYKLNYLSIILLPFSLTTIVIWLGFKVSFITPFVSIDYSYPLYLVHYPIIMIYLYFNFFKLNFLLSFLSILSLSFFISYLLLKIYGIKK